MKLLEGMEGLDLDSNVVTLGSLQEEVVRVDP